MKKMLMICLRCGAEWRWPIAYCRDCQCKMVPKTTATKPWSKEPRP